MAIFITGKVERCLMSVALPIPSRLAFDMYLSWVFWLANMSDDTQAANQLPVISLNSYAEPKIPVTAHIEDSSIKSTISAIVQT